MGNDKEEKRCRKKIAILIAFSTLMLAMPGIASADYDPWVTDLTLDDPALWLYIEGSTYNPSTSGDDWIAESWVNPVEFSHGGTYTDHVDVIAHNKENYAKDPYFFVWVKDDTLISSITVGQAHLFLGGTDGGTQGDAARTWTPNIGCTDCPCENQFTDSTSTYCSNEPLDSNPKKHQGQTGYWVRIQIGDVPAVLDFSFGDPTEGTWAPTNLKSYVRVPVTYTLTSDTTKDLTTLVIHYDAHNHDTDVAGSLQSNTPNSHDSSIYNVPEFSTIAIPIASILGLLFFFNRRKRRER